MNCWQDRYLRHNLGYLIWETDCLGASNRFGSLQPVARFVLEEIVGTKWREKFEDGKRIYMIVTCPEELAYLPVENGLSTEAATFCACLPVPERISPMNYLLLALPYGSDSFLS